MILAVDIGNSAVSLGYYEEDKLLKRVKVSSRPVRTRDECSMLLNSVSESFRLPPDEITGAIVSSVDPEVSGQWTRAVEDLIGRKPLILAHGVKTGLDMRIDLHTEVGADIVANMVGAALRLTPPFAVIDLGTATVISVAGKSGELLGTVIAPGVGVSVKALSSSAAALPDVSLSVPGSVIGRNTEESMKSGAVLGWASMIDGLIDRIMDEKGFDRMDLIACGGFASQVIPYCKREIPVAESLTTDGRARIYKLNLRTGRK